MSAIVEDLIVAMGFDNKQFEAAVKVSMATLTQLKTSLKFGGGKNGLDEVQESASRFHMNPVSTAIDGVSAKFLALSTVGITALSNIVNKAVDAGMNMAKALTLDPVMAGLEEYELNMNSIQTILANTQASGAGLEDVNNALDTLNTYADDTKYSFAEMAKNIGTFTAAGVDLDTSAASIKGIANLAALSGSNSQQASGAMYQLSQAISAGRVSLEDWNSVVNAGMGGTVFQRALAQTAEQMGTLSSGAVTLEGDMQNVSIAGKSFRESITAKPGQESWLTSEVLTETLKQFTGDLSDADLAAQGFSESQIKAIQAQAAVAKQAATEAKTFSDVYDSLKEGVGSGWATSWRTIIGDFEEAKTLWTGVYNTMDNMLGKSADARNALLSSWKDLGGRDALIDGLSNAFHALMSVVTPIKDAFREIFPPTTAATLVSMSVAFREFTERLKVGSETADKIKRTFAGVFAIFGIGWEVVKSLFSVFGQLFGAVGNGSGGFLSLTATIGDWVVKVHDAIKNGEIFQKIFGAIGTVLTVPIKLISNFGQALADVIGSIGSATSAFGQLWGVLSRGQFEGGIFEEDSAIVRTLFKMREGFVTAGSVIEQFWNILAKGNFVGGFFEEDSPIVTWLFKIRDALSSFFSSNTMSLLMGGAAGVGFGILIKNAIRKAFDFGGDDEDSLFGSMKSMFQNVGGAFENIGDMVDNVTGAFSAMQSNLKAGTLLKIGAAIGIVALSLKLLSTIDGGDLAKSLGAVSIAMAQLLIGMTILTKIAGMGGIAALPAVAIGLMGLAAAVLILSAAVKIMSTMSWEELAKGLSGLAAVLVMVVAAAYGLSKAEGSLIRAGLAMIPFAAAVRILVVSVEALSRMSWGELAKGLAGLAGVLVGVGGALHLMPKNMVSIGIGLMAVSAGMLLFSMSIEKLGNMDIKVLVQGTLGLAVALGLIGAALHAMPKNMIPMAAGLLLVSAALVGISGSVMALGGMSWEDLAKGLVGLGGALGIIAIALNLMSGTLAGSAALAVAAVSLALLLPSILALSMLSWEQLLIGMAGLAGTLTILGIAGALMGPVVPVLLILGAALALMGVGMLATGAGAVIFASGITAMAGAAALGQAALVNLMALIPQMAAAFAAGVISFVTTLANSSTELLGAVKTLIIAILDMVIELIPKIKDVINTLLAALVDIIITNAPLIGNAFSTLIQTLLNVLETNVPLIINTVFNLMMTFLQTIRDRIPEIVTVVTDIIVAFIQALQNNLPRIVQAGFEFIISFLNSLADAIRENLPLVADAALNVGSAIIDGVVQGIKNGLSRVINAAKDIASSALNAAKSALGIHSPSREFKKIGEWSTEGLVDGLEKGHNDIRRAGSSVAGHLLGSVNDELKKMSSVARTVWGILADGDYVGNGGILQEDSPIVDTLFNVREGLVAVGGAAEEVWSILGEGDFKGVGPWHEDSPIVDTLFTIREGFELVGGAAEEVWGIFKDGDFKGVGPWHEDDPFVDTLFDIRDGLDAVGGAAKEAWNILGEGDFKGQGPWHEDSPIVDTLFDIREGFEEFHSVGEDAIQGLIDGFTNGASAISQAAHDMAVAALDSAREALGIQSPSKKFKQIGEYSIDGLLMGLNDGSDKVSKAGNKLATGLVTGFSKGIGKEMPAALSSIMETLKTGAADAKFWGPNSPATEQLQSMNKALMEAEIRLAAFYGEVNMADPASIEAYVEKTGNSLKYLAGLLGGVEKSANRAFEMLESGKGLDVVLGDEQVLTSLVDGVLSVIPGIEAAIIRLGLAVIDGLLGIFFDTSVMGIIGDFITNTIRTVGGWFGIEFPVEEELDDANKELEDFLVNVEDTQGRFEKLSEEGIKAIAGTIEEANAAVDELDTEPTITPILDLSEYNKAKATMDTDMQSDVSVDTSSAQASSIYDERKALDANAAESSQGGNVTNIEFNQTNNSPKAIGHVEVYKNTQGQLSEAKEVLGVS